MSKKSDQKSKLKNVLPTIIMFIVFMGLGALLGFLVLGSGSDYIMGELLFDLALILISFILGLYINVIIHEFGHLIFGKISGYQFVSIQLLGILFMKKDGKLSVTRRPLSGAMGQCLMAPPPNVIPSKMPVKLYNLGGVLANAISGVIFLALFFALGKENPFGVFFLILSAVTFVLIIQNGVPMYVGGLANDGKNLQSALRDDFSRECLYRQLKVNEMLTRGTRLRDMPEELFEIPPNRKGDDPLISTIMYLNASRIMDRLEFEDAYSRMEELLDEPGLMQIHKNEIYCEQLFMAIVGDMNMGIINDLYTDKLKKYIKNTSMYLSRIRLMCAVSKFLDKNLVEAAKLKVKFERAAAASPYPGEVITERDMMRIVENKSS